MVPILTAVEHRPVDILRVCPPGEFLADEYGTLDPCRLPGYSLLPNRFGIRGAGECYPPRIINKLHPEVFVRPEDGKPRPYARAPHMNAYPFLAPVPLHLLYFNSLHYSINELRIPCEYANGSTRLTTGSYIHMRFVIR